MLLNYFRFVLSESVSGQHWSHNHAAFMAPNLLFFYSYILWGKKKLFFSQMLCSVLHHHSHSSSPNKKKRQQSFSFFLLQHGDVCRRTASTQLHNEWAGSITCLRTTSQPAKHCFVLRRMSPEHELTIKRKTEISCLDKVSRWPRFKKKHH